MAVREQQIDRARDLPKTWGGTRLILFGNASALPGEARHLDLACDGVSGRKLFEFASLPLLFGDSLAAALAGYRKFRHVVHYGYEFQLDWPRVREGGSRGCRMPFSVCGAVWRSICPSSEPTPEHRGLSCLQRRSDVKHGDGTRVERGFLSARTRRPKSRRIGESPGRTLQGEIVEQRNG